MKKKNVVLITSDQQHFDTLGVLNSEIHTPNLDRLANEGMLFNRAYCPNPTCTPTRASIITGKYPSQHGAWTLGTKLSENQLTVGDVLQEHSYRTALVGKAHFQPTVSTEEYPSIESYPLLKDLDFWKTYNESFYGFETVELARNHTNEHLVGQHYALWMEEKGCKNWRDYFLAPTGNMDPNQKYTWDIPEKYHYNTWIAERTNHFIEQYNENDDNFFVWASFFDPHPPYLVPEPWDQMYDPETITLQKGRNGEHAKNPPHFQLTQEENPDFSAYKETGFGIHGYRTHVDVSEEDHKKLTATYYAMVSMMDKYIGEILDKIDELGIAEDTVVIFTSDHGHLFGQHGMFHKGGFHYEDLIKVPFIAKCPGLIPSGIQTNAIQSLVDIAPTVLDLCQIPIPHEMTGLSQAEVWTGQKDEVRDHAICEFRHEPTTIHQKTYVNDRYKITVYYNQTYGELFDLENDPHEFNNLWDHEEYQELKAELFLKYIWAELGKEMRPMPRISHA